MYVENASRAMGGGFITVDNLEPNPKIQLQQHFLEILVTPTSLAQEFAICLNIANIIPDKNQGLQKEIFLKIIVPLDDDYSYDYVIKNEEINSKKVPIKKYWKKM